MSVRSRREVSASGRSSDETLRADTVRTDAGSSAFTLIELLVVIAILAVLIALMLATLSGSREAGRGVVCASNVRQLAMAADLYASDFADFLPPGMPGRLANLTRWHGNRANPSQAFSPDGGSMSEYLGPERTPVETGVRACPTFVPSLRLLAAAGVGFERGCGGYGYNTAFAGSLRSRVAGAGGTSIWVLQSDLSGSPRHRFMQPARTCLFADTAFGDGNEAVGYAEHSFLEPRFWPELPGERADPSVHARHAAAANVAWLDGHAGPERITFSWHSGFYPADPASLGIGWFGATDDNELLDYE